MGTLSLDQTVYELCKLRPGTDMKPILKSLEEAGYIVKGGDQADE